VKAYFRFSAGGSEEEGKGESEEKKGLWGKEQGKQYCYTIKKKGGELGHGGKDWKREGEITPTSKFTKSEIVKNGGGGGAELLGKVDIGRGRRETLKNGKKTPSDKTRSEQNFN